ncbi:MAG: hypothetical protein OEN56_06575 [Gemmatimonadota bacterium]|nr:hypothetical protein [Gemmatimonadota bacterium]
MLHTLRKFARELHRRSVWQVLGGYLLLWFGAFEAVVFMTGALGLPRWTPTMAFVLLAIGLPVILATTVVQSGLPGLRMVDLVDPNELEGLTPEDVHVIPEAHPLYGTGIFNWRNAILGGVMAAALLVTSVVAYLAMWAFGIGPVGSLVAQGIVQPDDTLVVAAFSNDTGDPSLGPRVRSLMETELSHSPLVHVFPLATSEASPGASTPSDAIDREVLARRAGARIVVEGAILSIDEGYMLSARIGLTDGTIVARFRQAVEEHRDIPEGVALLAVRVRERLGESLRDIRATPAPARAEPPG